MHRLALFSYALSRTGHRETAEDVVHGAFAQVLKKQRLPKEVLPYLYRCIRNGAVDGHRRAALRKEKDALFAAPNGATSPEVVARFKELEDALGVLESDEGEAIVLKLYGGLTFKEIAVVKGKSVNTVASWYRRGLEKLRKHLGEDSDA